ncbi:MAG: hypothetical protein ACKO2L_04615 [Planctomycetaceae bacterium]
MLIVSPGLLLLSTLAASIILTSPGALSNQAAITDEKNNTSEKVDKPQKHAKTFSVDDQKAALDFIREHHPELSHLLEQLQKSRPDEFRSALRDLIPQTQAILRMRDRLPARYPAQLAAWKRDSQIRLLMARWSRSQDPQIETQVRELIADRQMDRKIELEAEQQRIAEQLLKVQEQLKALQGDPQQLISTEWDQLARRASAATRSTKTPATPSGKTPARPAKAAKSSPSNSPSTAPTAPANSASPAQP